jgi:hypothetical protein
MLNNGTELEYKPTPDDTAKAIEILKSAGASGIGAEAYESLKAAGVFDAGSVTSDVALLTQGNALIQQSLNKVINEMALSPKTAMLAKQISKERVDNELHEYDEITDIGMTRNSSVSSYQWEATQKTGNAARKTVRVKYFTEAGGTVDTISKQNGAFVNMPAMEQARAMTRMEVTQAVNIWNGQGDGIVGGAAPLQIKGVSKWIDDGNWDGTHVIDLRDSGYSGIDGNGYSNPNDVENAQANLALALFSNENGNATVDEMWMSGSAIADIDKNHSNYTSYQVLSGEAQKFVQGRLVAGFTNRLSDSGLVVPKRDGFIPTGSKLKMANTDPNEPLLGATYVPASVAALVAAGGVSNRFTGAFVGSYRYYIVAIDKKGMESTYCTTGTGAPATAQTVTSGQKITLTISQSSSGLETGYAIYRSHVNPVGVDANKCRLQAIVTKTGATTVYVDENQDLPGGEEMYVGNLSQPGFIKGIYTLPPTAVELPKTLSAMAQTPFGIAATFAIYLGKSRWAGKIRNYISPSAKWSVISG